MTRLGIDFGTTRTVVVAVEDGNYPVCSFQARGELREYVPSMVSLQDGVLRYGWEAHAGLADPTVSVLRSMKRLAGDLRPDAPVELAEGHSVPLLDLVTGFLSHLRTVILEQSNLELDPAAPIEVMVASPANASSNQRYITLEAFRRAGFQVLGMLNEPSAAAIEYVNRHLRNLGPNSPKEYVVVYDLGGGTFDCSVVGLARHHYDVLAHEGIARLGGDDFDEHVLDAMLAEAGSARERFSSGQLLRLLEECRERKEGLKATTKKMVVDLSPAIGEEHTVVLTTDEVYERCQPLITRSLACVDAVMARLGGVGLDPDDARALAAVYLVGGSVAFPPVARALRERYGRKVRTSPFPHAAPAIGLAIAADSNARIQVSELVSRHFGVWREHEAGRDKIFDPIFDKERRLQAGEDRLIVERSYRPRHNVGHLRYLECSGLGGHGEPDGDVAMWREIYFPYAPELQDLGEVELAARAIEERHDLGGQDIVERYSYDAAGVIQVEIEDRTTGHRRVFSR